MSVEHDNLPISPRLDTLLRQIVAAGDLQPEQNQRVRAQLGLHPHQPTGRPTMTLPSSQPGPIHAPEQEGIPMISTTRARLRQQWLQFALAAVAFIAAGVVLALLFGSGSDEPEALPRASESIVFLHWLPEHEQFARQPTPTASPQPGDLPRGPAEISGELVVEGSCLRLEQTASGEAVLLIWPPEYVFEASAEGGQIRDDTGAAVVTVGGSVSFEGAFLAAGTDLPSFLNDPQASACAVPSYFLVGRVSTTTAATPAATDTSYEQVAPDLPTPDVTGSYNGLTLEQMVEQAQQVVPFEITVPQQIPDGLEAPAITVVTSPLPAVSGQVYRIEMLFELSGNESPSKSVLFTQTLSPVSSNPPEGETTTFGTPIGINVNRTTSTDAAGDPLLVYW